MGAAALAANCAFPDAEWCMAHEAERASLGDGLEDALADGYATVHELETRGLQLERHCQALVASRADAEQVQAVMRARWALGLELERLRTRLEYKRRNGD
jgi:hypothetical protein